MIFVRKRTPVGKRSVKVNGGHRPAGLEQRHIAGKPLFLKFFPQFRVRLSPSGSMRKEIVINLL